MIKIEYDEGRLKTEVSSTVTDSMMFFVGLLDVIEKKSYA